MMEVNVNRILCPVDFSQSSKRAARNAVHIARKIKAELTLLHVVPPLTDFFVGLRKKAFQEAQEKYARQKEQKFEQFVKGIDLRGLTWEKTVLAGSPAREILRHTKETECDLIVMGAVGLTHAPVVLVGRVAEKVIQGLPCSIVTVKQEDPIRVRLENKLTRVESRLAHGKELLENGFLEEAAKEFRDCIERDELCLSAWAGLAESYKHQGKTKEEARAREKAKEIQDRLWAQRVEADIRSHHSVWKKGI